MRGEVTIIYLSGPISGRQEDDARDHFSFVENLVQTESTTIMNPMDFPKRDSWEDYMKLGLKGLVGSDCIVMLQGWQKSRGASLERSVAFELGIPIYYEEDIGPWDSLGN